MKEQQEELDFSYLFTIGWGDLMEEVCSQVSKGTDAEMELCFTLPWDEPNNLSKRHFYLAYSTPSSFRIARPIQHGGDEIEFELGETFSKGRKIVKEFIHQKVKTQIRKWM